LVPPPPPPPPPPRRRRCCMIGQLLPHQHTKVRSAGKTSTRENSMENGKGASSGFFRQRDKSIPILCQHFQPVLCLV